MPLYVGSTSRSRNLLCEKVADFSVISPVELQPNESAREAASETLRQHRDLAVVIVLQEANWLAKCFEETWSALPSRLASLAIGPPTAAFVVTREQDSTRLLRHARDSDGALWRCLIELARDGSRVEIQSHLASSEFIDKSSRSEDSTESWLPELLSTPPRQELDWLFNELRLARRSDLCGEVVSDADATAVLAGLWLLHGDADESHRQSQSIEDEGRHRCGNFWHAIMHRQEPDYGNSKYWFRRVGQHPILPELARRADELIMASGLSSALAVRHKIGLPHRWDSFAFVDWCEAATCSSDLQQIQLLRLLQFVEMHLLLRASFADATQPT